jgi:hypothetical protein
MLEGLGSRLDVSHSFTPNSVQGVSEVYTNGPFLTDPGIWYMGGSIGQARYMSRFLALQIKADVEGVPFQPYEDTR